MFSPSAETPRRIADRIRPRTSARSTASGCSPCRTWRRHSLVLGDQRHAQVAAALLAGLESGAVHLGRHPDTERERGHALGRPQVRPGSKHAVPAREPLPENLIPTSSGRRFGSGAGRDGSNGRRHREDVVPECLRPRSYGGPRTDGACRRLRDRRPLADGSPACRRTEVGAAGRPPSRVRAEGFAEGPRRPGQGHGPAALRQPPLVRRRLPHPRRS